MDIIYYLLLVAVTIFAPYVMYWSIIEMETDCQNDGMTESQIDNLTV